MAVEQASQCNMPLSDEDTPHRVVCHSSSSERLKSDSNYLQEQAGFVQFYSLSGREWD